MADDSTAKTVVVRLAARVSGFWAGVALVVSMGLVYRFQTDTLMRMLSANHLSLNCEWWRLVTY